LKLLSTGGLRSVLKNRYQIFAGLTHFGFFSGMEDERYLKLLYQGLIGRPLHLDPPERFSEKVQWLKLHDKNPVYPVLCDKLAVRDFVSERIGRAYLTEMFGVWDDPDDIDFAALPDRFVLKCTHDSGSTILCTDPAAFDEAKARRQLRKHLRRDYSAGGREWPYHDVPRRVMAEEFLGDASGTRPDDYKFYCVRGRMLWVCVCTNRREDTADYYLCDRAFHPFWTNMTKIDQPETFAPEPPPRFQEMIELAERLASSLLHTRVDFYDTVGGIRFGEMTLYDQSGFIPEYEEWFDRLLGRLLDLHGELQGSERAQAEILNDLRNAFIHPPLA
jgi:hypothetical protein